MSTRRHTLFGVTAGDASHAGLWLDKYILDQSKEAEPGQNSKTNRQALVEEIAGIGQPKGYEPWFAQWQQSLQSYGAECRTAEVLGRMAIGLGQESVLETSVTIHHTYGVPYIPGSALKGLAASFAQQHLGDEWHPNTEAYQTLFGNTESAGYVTFFDVLPMPNSAYLHPDIITVHHPDYYQTGNRTVPPADWDSPNPVPFLSVTGKFLVALGGPEAWVDAAFRILEHALTHMGIGAKTSSGYGRMKLESARVMEPDEEKTDSLIRQIEALRTTEVAGGINAFYLRWRDLDVNDIQKRRVAEAIVAKVKEAKREKQSRKKTWYQELMKSLE